MLLNDIGSAPTTTLRKINQHLESNYGFKITENVQDKDLVAIMETIQDEITELKIKGDDAKGSPEISKRLLVLEGLKTLREFAILQLQSPKLEPVIRSLSDAVVKEFQRFGTNEADFNEAIKDAMKAYRSSEFRFPDDYIEQRVRHAAMEQINRASSDDAVMEEDETGVAEEDAEMSGINETDGEVVNEISSDLTKRYLGGAMQDTLSGKKDRNPGMARAVSRLSGTNKPVMPTEGEVEETVGGRERGQEYSQDWAMSRRPGQAGVTPADKNVPMVRNPKTGQLQPDPFAAQKLARQRGTSLGENKNLVKHLRALLETEVSQAEVMMAAKGFAQELQEMVEKIGRLQNEDLPPVTDQMRETYGMESASAFQTQIYGALQSVMDSLYTAKGQVDDAVGNMASTGQVSAAVDMDKELGDEEMPVDDLGADTADLDIDNIEGELGAEDEFGGAEGEEPLGRAMKTESLQRKVFEMRKLVEKARKLKEIKK